MRRAWRTRGWLWAQLGCALRASARSCHLCACRLLRQRSKQQTTCARSRGAGKATLIYACDKRAPTCSASSGSSSSAASSPPSSRRPGALSPAGLSATSPRHSEACTASAGSWPAAAAEVQWGRHIRWWASPPGGSVGYRCQNSRAPASISHSGQCMHGASSSSLPPTTCRQKHKRTNVPASNQRRHTWWWNRSPLVRNSSATLGTPRACRQKEGQRKRGGGRRCSGGALR